MVISPVFDFDSFCVNYPTIAGQTTSNLFSNYQANNIYTNEVTLQGSKILALLNNPSFNSWDASTNDPTLSNDTGTMGTIYLCNVGGTVDFGAGDITFNINDIVEYGKGGSSIWSNQGYSLYYYVTCLILAHILTLQSTQQSGRVATATTGTVNTGMDYSMPYSAAWFNLTSFGQRAWHLIPKRGGATWFGVNSYNGFPIGVII